MNKPTLASRSRLCMAVLGLLLASGCSSLLPKGAAPPLVYVLDGAQDARAMTPAPVTVETAPTLFVSPTRAAPGYDTQHIVYTELAHQLHYFAYSDWVDTPAHMLVPVIVAAMENTASFRAVAAQSHGVVSDLRLDSEILRLQQEFGDGTSRVRFALRVTLSDSANRQVMSWQAFEEAVPCASEDPYGGVVAANHAVQLVMASLERYAIQAAASWRASEGLERKVSDDHRSVH